MGVIIKYWNYGCNYKYLKYGCNYKYLSMDVIVNI